RPTSIQPDHRDTRSVTRRGEREAAVLVPASSAWLLLARGHVREIGRKSACELRGPRRGGPVGVGGAGASIPAVENDTSDLLGDLLDRVVGRTQGDFVRE